MQTDPIGYEDGVNWYAYVGNDPINVVDPTGKIGMDSGKLDRLSGEQAIQVQLTDPKTLNAVSEGAATVAIAAGAVGHVEIAIPATVISAVTSYGAALQDDNPLEAVAVNTVTDAVAKPISLAAKALPKDLSDTSTNFIESTLQGVEELYKKVITSEE